MMLLNSPLRRLLFGALLALPPGGSAVLQAPPPAQAFELSHERLLYSSTAYGRCTNLSPDADMVPGVTRCLIDEAAFSQRWAQYAAHCAEVANGQGAISGRIVARGSRVVDHDSQGWYVRQTFDCYGTFFHSPLTTPHGLRVAP